MVTNWQGGAAAHLGGQPGLVAGGGPFLPIAQQIVDDLAVDLIHLHSGGGADC